MAPALFQALPRLLESTLQTGNTPDADIASLGPRQANAIVLARDASATRIPGQGAIPPTEINDTAVFVLFGLIGAAFVVLGMWFFFWAKNGGFHFRQNDWDDYKSTVLRRRGPNGTILSGATPSTQLGGGSVYKDYDDGTNSNITRTQNDASTVVSGTTGITGITGGASDVAGREKRRRKREQKERERERRRESKAREKREKKQGGSRKVGPDGALIDEQAEAEAMDHLRQYRHERPARVGGINKESEGSAWDGSTNPSHSVMSGSVAMSEAPLMAHRERTPTKQDTTKRDAAGAEGRSPTKSPTKQEKTPPSGMPRSGGIRKVYSTADKTAAREAERIRAEARKLQEKGRAAAAVAAAAASSSSSSSSSSPPKRRDFSWQRTSDMGGGLSEETSAVASSSRNSEVTVSHVPGSWQDSQVGTASDAGTKVYQHPVHIPGTRSSDLGYAEEKRKKRNGAGHRRDRGDV